jgi:hypothetical protein
MGFCQILNCSSWGEFNPGPYRFDMRPPLREVLMALKIQVEVFWVVAGYQRFGRSCCLHLQPEDGGSNFALCQNPEDPDWSTLYEAYIKDAVVTGNLHVK